MRKERRTTLRVPFVACAEITEAGTNVSIGARISDISRDGCYVDLRSALPEGTSVQIKIKTATEFFEASAVLRGFCRRGLYTPSSRDGTRFQRSQFRVPGSASKLDRFYETAMTL